MTKITIPNGVLKDAAEALATVGRQRPWRVAVKIAHMTVDLRTAASQVDEKRKSLIRQFDPEGKGWSDPSEAPADFLEAFAALMAEPFEMEAEPLTVDEMDRGDSAADHDDSEQVALLLHYGLLVDGDE